MMKKIFLVEQQFYEIHFLRSIFDNHYLGLLKTKKICIEDESKNIIKFQFVGFLIYKDKLIFIVPKYLKEYATNENYLFNKMKVILKVMESYGKYNKVTDKDFDFIEDTTYTQSNNIFSVAKFIIDDYLKFGLYQKNKNNINLNGNGEILWNRTVNEIEPIFSNGTPHYFNKYTLHKFNDDSNLIIELHKWAISFSYHYFGELLGVNKLIINPPYSLSILGSEGFIRHVINKELNQTFVDHKIHLLKSILAIIDFFFEGPDERINLFGIKSFAHVWEKVCAHAFNNCIDKFIDRIPSPTWQELGSPFEIKKESFIPDIITTFKLNKQDYFWILDAKYYDIKFTKNSLINNPSVNDVSKQLLYELAFKQETKHKVMRNIFLFPSNEIGSLPLKVFGHVKLDFISKEPIFLVYLSDEKVYNMFLNKNSFSLNDYSELEGGMMTLLNNN
ncbi:LlaJI family restriction endonuclease [Bacillus halotolerans]|nr:LlaJI family restriction endonuclease [Bacillus halotolerans]WIG47510.1 LlaJI family restriction endonuclease [Bacillus halotolerans]